ncbi:MAG: ectoine hydroxylase-related dioxygenase (phytanoyl-CoA dioxygenase family) [Vicingaceae bacterium]|jgi:ectoine hydroxylase-related dioxygenase (phytanoyl-CoA dioxygenase family)
MLNINVKEFDELGFTVIRSAICEEKISEVGSIALRLKKEFGNEAIIGKTKNFGVPTFWKGLDMASKYDSTLFNHYTSDLMKRIASQLLKSKEFYLFNDQIVVKEPKEDFEFTPHCDNEYGPNLELAKKGIFKTITCCWVLDDFTNVNGPIQFVSKSNEKITPLPTAGSIIVWDGNTIHSSSINKSDKIRSVWLLIYSSTDIHKISTSENYFDRFYNDKIICD